MPVHSDGRWHRTTRVWLLLISVICLLLLAAQRAVAAAAIAKGDLVVSLSNGYVDEYTPAGQFVQHLITPSDGLVFPTGSAFDGNGNLYVTDFSGNKILRRDALTGAVSVFASNSTLGDGDVFDSPESIVFDRGYKHLYISDADRFGPGGGINVVDASTGAGTGFYPLPSSNGSEGSGESDWLAFDANSTLYMTNENPTQGVMRVDPTTGDIEQPSVVSNLPNYAYALSFDKNGNMWVGATDRILEFTTSGAPINVIQNSNFSTIFAAVFNPAGDQFYAGDLSTGTIYTYALDGSLAGNFNAGSGVSGLAVAGATVPPNTGEAGIKIAGNANEPVVAVNPTNPKNIVVAFNHAVNGEVQCGYRTSMDGGASWNPPLTAPPNDLPLPAENGVTLRGGGDPSLAFTGSGLLYFGCLSGGDADQTGDPSSTELFAAASATGGQTFGISRFLVRGFTHVNKDGSSYGVKPDLESVAGDPRHGSTGAYMCFQEFVTTPSGNTTDGINVIHLGATGSPPAIQKLGTASATAGTHETPLGCTTTVSSSGRIWVGWRNTGANRAEVDHSDNGGTSFTGVTPVGPMNGKIDTCNGGCFNPGRRVYLAAAPGGGDDRIVAVWEDFRAGVSDQVDLATFSGASWSPSAVLAAPATQPSLAWGIDGQVVYGYYANPFSPHVGAALTYQIDRAPPSAAFAAPLGFGTGQSTELQNLSPFVPPNYSGRFGDYNGVASAGNAAYGVWTDNGSSSGGTQAVWFGHS
jgi:hypothetical protein